MPTIFENMLSRYQIATKDDLTNAAHEVMQQIVLAGMQKKYFLKIIQNTN